MSDISEGVGAAIEGALAGKAVEPKHGVAPSQGCDPAGQGQCQNCGTETIGSHCHRCGQKTHIHRSLAAIGHDIMHGVLHLDGKLWRTLPMLIAKPGALTRRYIDGERAKFVSPMAMFLFSVFLMFAVFQMLGVTTPTDLNNNGFSEAIEADAQAELDNATERLANADEGSAEFEQATEDIEAARGAISAMNEVRAVDLGENAEINLTGIKAIDEGLVKKWQENPSLMLYKLQTNAYKFSWLLIPISIPFVWILFAWKRRFKAYDHAIFVTYSLSFMTILFITASLLITVGAPLPIVVLSTALIPPIHLYKQLRYSYTLGRFGAFWRLLVLSIFIWIAVALFLQALLALGAF